MRLSGCARGSGIIPKKLTLLRVSACKTEAIALYFKLRFVQLAELGQQPQYRHQDGILKTEPKLWMVRDAGS
ncbi:hypothetical protein [Laspinema olomoucense]|uniref:hypothetical protein n=1 Tax=Laspinema olomoucense TaxID=3231600 RepID=UPI0021BB6D59|nr:hypothetical protein [Laspinema sp. D3c]MCT7992566.1 hypothetical protein [Laspinema sp. D3c]